MEKTTKQHFLDSLPKTVAAKAIKNTISERLEATDISASESLARAFAWSKSNEGFKYWLVRFEKLLSNEN